MNKTWIWLALGGVGIWLLAKWKSATGQQSASPILTSARPGSTVYVPDGGQTSPYGDSVNPGGARSFWDYVSPIYSALTNTVLNGGGSSARAGNPVTVSNDGTQIRLSADLTGVANYVTRAGGELVQSIWSGASSAATSAWNWASGKQSEDAWLTDVFAGDTWQQYQASQNNAAAAQDPYWFEGQMASQSWSDPWSDNMSYDQAFDYWT